MKELKERIKREAKARGVNLGDIAKDLGYSDSSGLTNALTRGSLRFADFMRIAEMLSMDPADLFPGPGKIDVEKVTMIDLIRHVCRLEIIKHAETHHD